MTKLATTQNITFRSVYLELTPAEQFFIKLLSYGAYSVLAGAAFLFVSSGMPRFTWLGFLLLLFLGDRMFQLILGEQTIDSRLVQKIEKDEAVNVAPYFQSRTIGFLERARRRSADAPDTFSLGLFDDLLAIPEIKIGLSRLDISCDALRAAIRSVLDQRKDAAGDDIDELVREVGIASFAEATHLGERSVSPAALFLGLLATRVDDLREIFAKFNFVEADFHNAIIFGRLARGLGRMMQKRIAAGQGVRRRPHRIMNRAWTARPTDYLDSVGQDITHIARLGQTGFLVGHDGEYRTMVNVLAREDKNNVMLVGPAGVGKETIIGHLAHEIIRDEVPAKLFDRRLVAVNLASVVAGARTAGEAQEHVRRLIEDVLAAGNIILYFPDIHNLRLTAQEGLNALDALKPVFASSIVPTIGTTTPQEFHHVVEKDQSFRELFDVVEVAELSEDEAVRFLTYESYVLEAKWNIIISYRAICRAVKLAKRFLREKPLPSSAVDLLQEALADARAKKLKVLSEKEVSDLVAAKTNVPVEIAAGKEAAKLLELETYIHQRLVNQEEAVKAVASAMRQYRAGLARSSGPIATFLFVGPTGVGKTELAKTLAEIYFGGEDEMVRFDMGEYQEPKSIWNLIGAPDGAMPGNLTEEIKKKPFSVLLLDEFEKAHHDILELFLPLFDEGKLKNSLGETVDFTNAIVVCTSNAHSNFIKEEIEKGSPIGEISRELKRRLTEYFKPELLNRFDDIIVFRPLRQDEIEKIAGLHLKQIAKHLAAAQGIEITFTPEVPKLLAKLGWDPVFGARPLRGVIREKIREILAQEILKQNIARGNKVMLNVSGEAFVFEKS